MTDDNDLVKRLRNAATKRDGFDAVYLSPEAADRIEALEAKLAKAVDALGTALDEMVDYADTHPSWAEIWEAREAARTTLNELKGEDRG